MSRRILYISGTRADFGLMRRTLQALEADPSLALSVLVAGMHLSPAYGETVREIEASGLSIVARVPFALEPTTGATMARGIATMIARFTTVLENERPHVVLLLGDRGEMLAGAIAALHLSIPVAHIHGGERSGTVDEPIRHAISKLSHLHLAATREAGDRLIRMGENPRHVHVTGAPGIDGLDDETRVSRLEFATRHGLDPGRPIALMVYHPVLQQAVAAGGEAAVILDTILATGIQALVLMPNADAGSDDVRMQLETRNSRPGVALATHLEREAFLDAMANADVMVGNSSAGIIEAASFGTPVINVGSRQNLRERNANVVDARGDAEEIAATIAQAIARGRFTPTNVYGEGQAAARIVTILRDTPLDPQIMIKVNGY